MSFITKQSSARQSETGGSVDRPPPPVPEKDQPYQEKKVTKADSSQTSGEYEVSYNFNWKRKGVYDFDLEKGMTPEVGRRFA